MTIDFLFPSLKNLILGLALSYLLTFPEAYGQSSPDLVNRLVSGGAAPENLLSSRSAVIYDYQISLKELEQAQQAFQQTGIDAIAYFDAGILSSGRDPDVALASYFIKRNIANLVFLLKTSKGFTLYIAPFSNNSAFVKSENVWGYSAVSLSDVLQHLFVSVNSLPRENFLINDIPEMDMTIDPIPGKRFEFFALDLKVDPVAIPKTGNAEWDKKLEEIFSTWPYKYKLTEPGTSERELRRQGYMYVLNAVHTRALLAYRLLGYTGKSENAIASVTYPNGELQIKSILIETPAYKFYFKHIDSGNVFLGTKWDADTTWELALQNHIVAFKKELRIN